MAELDADFLILPESSGVIRPSGVTEVDSTMLNPGPREMMPPTTRRRSNRCDRRIDMESVRTVCEMPRRELSIFCRILAHGRKLWRKGSATLGYETSEVGHERQAPILDYKGHFAKVE